MWSFGGSSFWHRLRVSQVVWGRKQLRGCILGRAFNLYMDFDTWRHGTFAQHTGKTSRQRLNTLREWCSMYEPPGVGCEAVKKGTSCKWWGVSHLVREPPVVKHLP